MATIAHIKPNAATLVVAIALMAAAVAQAAPGAAAQRPGAENARSSGSVPHGLVAEGGAAARPTEIVMQGGGIDRWDGAIAAGILVGVLLTGLWGHLVVGGAVVGVATLGEAGARLVARKPGRGRGWSDWPGPAADPVEPRKDIGIRTARIPIRDPSPPGARFRSAGAGARSRPRSRRTSPNGSRRAR
jgi:hypothetical protein